MLTIGFKVKSGYAIGVVLGGSAQKPQSISRHILEMSDPKDRWTRQPYHNRMFKTETDEDEIARRVKIVERCAKKSVEDLLGNIRRSAALRHAQGIPSLSGDESLALRRAALVVGSVVDPATLGSPHMRAHANEGRLFRTVLEKALQSHGIDVDVIVEKALSKQASAVLGRSAAAISKVVAGFGEQLGKPWRTEEKAAATAAWAALATKWSSN